MYQKIPCWGNFSKNRNKTNSSLLEPHQSVSGSSSHHHSKPKTKFSVIIVGFRDQQETTRASSLRSQELQQRSVLWSYFFFLVNCGAFCIILVVQRTTWITSFFHLEINVKPSKNPFVHPFLPLWLIVVLISLTLQETSLWAPNFHLLDCSEKTRPHNRVPKWKGKAKTHKNL